jgi:hypothetical protein
MPLPLNQHRPRQNNPQVTSTSRRLTPPPPLGTSSPSTLPSLPWAGPPSSGAASPPPGCTILCRVCGTTIPTGIDLYMERCATAKYLIFYGSKISKLAVTEIKITDLKSSMLKLIWQMARTVPDRLLY